MNEERFGREIRGYLNWGLEIPENKLARLRSAREHALARQRVSRFAFLPLIAGGGAASWGVAPVLARVVFPVLVLVAAAYGYDHWQGLRATEDLAELDAQILSSDLPIDAFLDAGFDQWLKKQGE